MTSDNPEALGRLDDATEEQETASTPAGGAAAAGDYDPAEGSPGSEHPTGEGFPDEAVRFDDPDQRPRSDAAD